MDLTRGYNLTPSVQSRLRLLDWIGDNGGATPGANVELGPLFAEPDGDSADAIAANLRALDDEDLIRVHPTLTFGGWSCEVLPAGVDLIEDLRAVRGDLLGRRKAARDAFLTWLHNCTLRGDRSPVSSNFRTSPYGTYYGHEFTEEETNIAASWLLDEGFIKGTASFGGGVPRPMITTRGEQVVESGRSVNDGDGVNVVHVGSATSTQSADRRGDRVGSSPNGSIFLVHGRDHAVLHHAVRVLERATGRDVIVLHEKANVGRTILEKFEHHAVEAAYAVVLLTGDDEGGLAGGRSRSRGRQNVVFELGFFFGKLGRQRVAVLLGEGVEQPSDINGLVYISLDAGGGWVRQLCRELEAAGIPINYSRIP